MLDRAKLREMRRDPLEVEEAEPSGAEAVHERGEGDLGGIGRRVEHRFAEEGATERNP